MGLIGETMHSTGKLTTGVSGDICPSSSKISLSLLFFYLLSIVLFFYLLDLNFFIVLPPLA